ncbi:Chromodomain-helicase-DNA-binding protein 4 [Morella rubra]|uniref:Chromodomain-helicase-DNA-binding protein 4 n=1 Tax=Morella rubra TaxID=262757 RepID=A0A6A1WED8_9ROSI|nr:Chromodomain-helicase-DNA-binding protein 4 [Morella rubra]
MKRELEVKLEPGDSLGDGNRVDMAQASSACVEVSESANSICKKFKGSVVNGLIVYTRERKCQFILSNGPSENGHSKRLRSSDELEINIKASVEEVHNGEEVQFVVGDEPICDMGIPLCKESELVQSSAREGGAEKNIVAIAAGSSERINGLPKEEVRLLMPSAVRPKVELEQTETLVNASNSHLDGQTAGGVSPSKTLKSKLELKMSKKIALNKKPMTVRELFETGLLDGVTVVYMGANKIIPPSKFEIHACKTYKRAAQYICLENGKSLLDLLRVCRASPLHTLEATIQNIIGSLPEENYFTCKRCKGCFPWSCVTKLGLLCNSCVDSVECQGTPIPDAGKIVRASTPVLISKSPRAASVSISQDKGQWKASISVTKTSALLKVLQNCFCIDQRLHKLVFEECGLPDGTEVAYYARGQKLLEGYKKGFGIFCRCCNSEVSPSQFEAHAGWASRRKPYAYIYTSNGVSLHELAISLSKGRKYSAKDNDNLCISCGDGGNLVLCDGCPRAFHKECASLTSIPPGDWYCTYCQNMFEREKFVEHNENAVAAGRVSGVDPIEQITKRCIRIVRNIEADISGCVLCRGYDFSKSGFGPRTILLCDQCEMEFHVGCLRDHKMAFLKTVDALLQQELPEGEWFCSMDCTRINSTLQKLLVRGDEKLPGFLLDVIKRKQEERGLNSIGDVDIRWRLLSGKVASPETRFYLSEAVAIFHNCFAPIIDSISGRDLIPAMVYGKNIRGQEFGGMYCAILMVNSSVVSAGLLRVFGREVAELPLVATSNGNHGKGYFQILFSCIEKLLSFLNVKSLVLPAAEEAESIWTDKFGFERMKPDQLSRYRRSCYQMVTFKGTSMLQKMVRQCRVISP